MAGTVYAAQEQYQIRAANVLMTSHRSGSWPWQLPCMQHKKALDMCKACLADIGQVNVQQMRGTCTSVTPACKQLDMRQHQMLHVAEAKLNPPDSTATLYTVLYAMR